MFLSECCLVLNNYLSSKLLSELFPASQTFIFIHSFWNLKIICYSDHSETWYLFILAIILKPDIYSFFRSFWNLIFIYSFDHSEIWYSFILSIILKPAIICSNPDIHTASILMYSFHWFIPSFLSTYFLSLVVCLWTWKHNYI